MNQPKAFPKPLGNCLYCTQPVTDQDGVDMMDGTCHHFECSRMLNRQSVVATDFLRLVLKTEKIVVKSTILRNCYWDNLPNPLVPQAYLRLIEQLALRARESDRGLVQDLQAVLNELRSLCNANN